jgi:hypothetical protein
MLEMEKALFSQLRNEDPASAGEGAEGGQVVRVAVKEKKEIRWVCSGVDYTSWSVSGGCKACSADVQQCTCTTSGAVGHHNRAHKHTQGWCGCVLSCRPAAKLLPIVRVVPAGAGSSIPRSSSLTKSSSLKAAGASGELIQRQASSAAGEDGGEGEREAKRHKSGQLPTPQGSQDVAQQASAAVEEKEEEEGGLQQLLGGYGSSSDDEGGRAGKEGTGSLPSAEQLLKDIAKPAVSQIAGPGEQASAGAADGSTSNDR